MPRKGIASANANASGSGGGEVDQDFSPTE